MLPAIAGSQRSQRLMTTSIQRSRAAAQADWPWPEVAVLPWDAPEAFAARHSPAIVATKVIFKKPSRARPATLADPHPAPSPPGPPLDRPS
jgi:hypothetical protein